MNETKLSIGSFFHSHRLEMLSATRKNELINNFLMMATLTVTKGIRDSICERVMPGETRKGTNGGR